MSIKLTKMYTIRYTQGPNNYFTQSLRHFVGVDMDLGVRRRLDSGGRWVQSPRSWCARRSQPSRTLDQKSLQDHFTLHSCPSSRAEEQEISTSFPYLHRVVMYTMYIECTAPLSLTSDKKLRPSSSERGLHRLSKHHVLSHWVRPQRRVSQYNKSTSPESRCGWIHDSGQKKSSKTKHFAVEFT